MNSTKKFIAVAGNIGSGKTTLTQMLSEHYGWEPHFEAVQDNPYLEDFYADMGRWSFPLQIFFLHHRFKAHWTISHRDCSAIQDRSIYEDAHIFARNLFDEKLLSDRDYQNYLSVYRSMVSLLNPPDLVIYLKKSVPVLKQRIALRGRSYEQNIPDRYLECLNYFYDDWLEKYQDGKKLIIESDELDFVKSNDDFLKICQKIDDTFDQPDLIPLKTSILNKNNQTQQII